MRDKDVVSFSGAYHTLIMRGLGPGNDHKADSLGQFILAQRSGYIGHTKFPVLKALLIRALTKLLYNTRYGLLPPELINWKQTIQAAESSAELGLFCVRVLPALFPCLPREKAEVFSTAGDEWDE